MNGENLFPSSNFTVEKKIGNLYMILAVHISNLTSWMKYSITTIFFSIRKGPEYLFRLFEVLPKQGTCIMKVEVEVEVYIQHWFHDEQRAKFM